MFMYIISRRGFGKEKNASLGCDKLRSYMIVYFQSERSCSDRYVGRILWLDTRTILFCAHLWSRLNYPIFHIDAIWKKSKLTINKKIVLLLSSITTFISMTHMSFHWSIAKHIAEYNVIAITTTIMLRWWNS